MVLGLLLLGQAGVSAQGRFSLTITGFELINGQPSPVEGTGSLELFGSTLNYNINVRLTIPPAETHFHGPVVGEGMPQFSLAPYERQSADGIMFRGNHRFDPKYVPDIQAGNWYVQLHSPDYVNGMMRGYILPIPEPGMAAILGMGLLALWCGIRGIGSHREFTEIGGGRSGGPD